MLKMMRSSFDKLSQSLWVHGTVDVPIKIKSHKKVNLSQIYEKKTPQFYYDIDSSQNGEELVFEIHSHRHQNAEPEHKELIQFRFLDLSDDTIEEKPLGLYRSDFDHIGFFRYLDHTKAITSFKLKPPYGT